jgi:hypothetical protein
VLNQPVLDPALYDGGDSGDSESRYQARLLWRDAKTKVFGVAFDNAYSEDAYSAEFVFTNNGGYLSVPRHSSLSGTGIQAKSVYKMIAVSSSNGFRSIIAERFGARSCAGVPYTVSQRRAQAVPLLSFSHLPTQHTVRCLLRYEVAKRR